MRLIIALLLVVASVSAATYNSDGTPSNINSLVASASTGDIITMPAGSFSWTSTVTINKNITLRGAGVGSTIITANSAPRLLITGGGAATDFSITGPASAGAGIIACYTVSGWRVGRISLTTGNNSNQAFNADCPGVLFDSTINSGNGTDEGVWTTALGGTGAQATQDAVWATDPVFGTADAIYVENCTFNGSGYVSDFGYASRAVVRYCTITGKSKIDAHGPESNWRSNRQIESYRNTWDCSAIGGDPFFVTHDIRGGAALIFDNVVTGSPSSSSPAPLIHHYGPETNIYGESYAPLLQHQFWTPYEYPLPDQQAVGKNPGKVAHANPLYVFNNTLNGSPTNYFWTQDGFRQVSATTNTAGYSVGATNITLTAMTGALGTFYAGNVIQFDGDSNYYTVAADRVGAGVLQISAPGLLQSIPASVVTVRADSIIKYRYQTGNPSATFDMQDIIMPDRDIFISTPTFNGSSGVGRGTYAQMQAITGTTTGVGFWVTDRGSWNTTVPAGTSGQLWTWNGSAWVFAYEPYTYPHPLTEEGDVNIGRPSSQGVLVSQ